MLRITFGSTPSSLASTELFRELARTPSTCIHVSFALPLRSPRAERPLATLSATLSAGVPSLKWLGFTQAGVSQLWSTHMPSGMYPTHNS
jgi:hypothetical protein